MLDDTQTRFLVSTNQQISLQCKAKSLQKPTTIKWFKRKDENDFENAEPYQNFLDNYRSIKYFENFYEPWQSLGGIKELSDNIYLSKLLVNDVEKNSVFVCIAVNYYGFSVREISVNFIEDDYHEIIFDLPENKSKVLFLIPVVLLLPISIMFCTILYLLINRQILKRNKIPETIFL